MGTLLLLIHTFAYMYVRISALAVLLPESVVNPKPHLDHSRRESAETLFNFLHAPPLGHSRRAIQYSPQPTHQPLVSRPLPFASSCAPRAPANPMAELFSCNAISSEKHKSCARLFYHQGCQCSAAASCWDGRTMESWKDGRLFAVERLLENTLKG